jgi:hypothetical protein
MADFPAHCFALAKGRLILMRAKVVRFPQPEN